MFGLKSKVFSRLVPRVLKRIAYVNWICPDKSTTTFVKVVFKT